MDRQPIISGLKGIRMRTIRCPRCSGKMKVISVIEDPEIVKKILKHLDPWD